MRSSTNDWALKKLVLCARGEAFVQSPKGFGYRFLRIIGSASAGDADRLLITSSSSSSRSNGSVAAIAADDSLLLCGRSGTNADRSFCMGRDAIARIIKVCGDGV